MSAQPAKIGIQFRARACRHDATTNAISRFQSPFEINQSQSPICISFPSAGVCPVKAWTTFGVVDACGFALVLSLFYLAARTNRQQSVQYTVDMPFNRETPTHCRHSLPRPPEACTVQTQGRAHHTPKAAPDKQWGNPLSPTEPSEPRRNSAEGLIPSVPV